MDFLMIFVSLMIGILIGCFLMKQWVESDLRDQAKETANNLNSINARLANHSSGFILITTQLADMSAKAKATFAYIYVQSIKDDHSLMSSLHKYVTNALDGKDSNP